MDFWNLESLPIAISISLSTELRFCWLAFGCENIVTQKLAIIDVKLNWVYSCKIARRNSPNAEWTLIIFSLKIFTTNKFLNWR